jgi:hypothetical protein
MPPDAIQLNMGDEFTKEMTVHKSLNQEVIVITADKVRLCLIDHKNALLAKREWLVPLGMLTTILVTLLTAQFKNWLVAAETWSALFMLAALVCSIWLLLKIGPAWKNRGSNDVEQIVNGLKARQVGTLNTADNQGQK